jgi:small subunit ribosomal protein S21
MAVNFSIKVRKGVPIQKALKKLKKKYQEYGIREELMNRREYTKPTTKRRKEKMDAIRNYKKAEQDKKELDG